jgi:hypothetical protein
MKQTTKSQTTTQESLSRSDPAIAKLAKVAFANVADFARFNPDGSVEIFDWEKAKEIGAKVSVVTRKEGRGKNARELRITEIKMPNKFPALVKLLKYLTPPVRKPPSR